jgi:hypothetical protein
MKNDNCKHCGEHVDLEDEGYTYQDGTCAHDQCGDGNSFREANEGDWD